MESKEPFSKKKKSNKIDPVQVEAAITELQKEFSTQLKRENDMHTQTEAVKPKAVKKSASTGVKKSVKKATVKTTNKTSEGVVSLSDIAKENKVDAFILRKALRREFKKPGASWSWPKGHPDIKAATKVAISLKK